MLRQLKRETKHTPILFAVLIANSLVGCGVAPTPPVIEVCRIQVVGEKVKVEGRCMLTVGDPEKTLNVRTIQEMNDYLCVSPSDYGKGEKYKGDLLYWGENNCNK